MSIPAILQTDSYCLDEVIATAPRAAAICGYQNSVFLVFSCSTQNTSHDVCIRVPDLRSPGGLLGPIKHRLLKEHVDSEDDIRSSPNTFSGEAEMIKKRASERRNRVVRVGLLHVATNPQKDDDRPAC